MVQGSGATEEGLGVWGQGLRLDVRGQGLAVGHGRLRRAPRLHQPLPVENQRLTDYILRVKYVASFYLVKCCLILFGKIMVSISLVR